MYQLYICNESTGSYKYMHLIQHLHMYKYHQEVDQLPDEINFHDLKVGDTVGLLYTNSGTLHLFINGAHVVTLPCTVPVGVYGLVDLYGQCVKVSLRPLTPWSGGSPLHVMADNSALDQQRKQLAGKLSMSPVV